MTLERRGFLFGLLAAPAIIRTPGLLMPVRPAVVTGGEPSFLLGLAPIKTEGGRYYWQGDGHTCWFRYEAGHGFAAGVMPEQSDDRPGR